eukprot:Rhum_TRINITY_DN14870_c10_g1::Rhum_TRINITY_DN14870_c10_g1_i1::g.126253::m.126253
MLRGEQGGGRKRGKWALHAKYPSPPHRLHIQLKGRNRSLALCLLTAAGVLQARCVAVHLALLVVHLGCLRRRLKRHGVVVVVDVVDGACAAGAVGVDVDVRVDVGVRQRLDVRHVAGRHARILAAARPRDERRQVDGLCRALAAEGRARQLLSVLEQPPRLLQRPLRCTPRSGRHRLLRPRAADHAVRQVHLRQLPLQDALLERAPHHQPVHAARPRLPLPPDARHSLQVVRGVPVHVRQDQPRAPHQVQPDPARLAAEQQHLERVAPVVERVHELHPLRSRHPAVQPRTPAPQYLLLDRLQHLHRRRHHNCLVPLRRKLPQQTCDHLKLPVDGRRRRRHRLRRRKALLRHVALAPGNLRRHQRRVEQHLLEKVDGEKRVDDAA